MPNRATLISLNPNTFSAPKTEHNYRVGTFDLGDGKKGSGLFGAERKFILEELDEFVGQDFYIQSNDPNGRLFLVIGIVKPLESDADRRHRESMASHESLAAQADLNQQRDDEAHAAFGFQLDEVSQQMVEESDRVIRSTPTPEQMDEAISLLKKLHDKIDRGVFLDTIRVPDDEPQEYEPF